VDADRPAAQAANSAPLVDADRPAAQAADRGSGAPPAGAAGAARAEEAREAAERGRRAQLLVRKKDPPRSMAAAGAAAAEAAGADKKNSSRMAATGTLGAAGGAPAAAVGAVGAAEPAADGAGSAETAAAAHPAAAATEAAAAAGAAAGAAGAEDSSGNEMLQSLGSNRWRNVVTAVAGSIKMQMGRKQAKVVSVCVWLWMLWCSHAHSLPPNRCPVPTAPTPHKGVYAHASACLHACTHAHTYVLCVCPCPSQGPASKAAERAAQAAILSQSTVAQVGVTTALLAPEQLSKGLRGHTCSPPTQDYCAHHTSHLTPWFVLHATLLTGRHEGAAEGHEPCRC